MITTAQFLEMQARCSRNRGHQDNNNTDDGGTDREADLHDQILAECRRRLWPVVHSRMDTKTTTAKGVPDFIIFADAGRVFPLEAKSRTGKMTPEQIGWKLMLERNGHRYFLVRSFAEFLDVINNNQNN